MYLFSLGASVTLLIPTVLISIVLILFSPQHPYRVVVVAGEWMRGWVTLLLIPSVLVLITPFELPLPKTFEEKYSELVRDRDST